MTGRNPIDPSWYILNDLRELVVKDIHPDTQIAQLDHIFDSRLRSLSLTEKFLYLGMVMNSPDFKVITARFAEQTKKSLPELAFNWFRKQKELPNRKDGR